MRAIFGLFSIAALLDDDTIQIISKFESLSFANLIAGVMSITSPRCVGPMNMMRFFFPCLVFHTPKKREIHHNNLNILSEKQITTR